MKPVFQPAELPRQNTLRGTGTPRRFRGAPSVPLPPGGGSGGAGLGRAGSAFGTAARIAGIGTGIGLVAAGVHAWQRANHELIEKSDNAAEAYDTLSRSLNIQAGFSDADNPATRRRMSIKAMRAAAARPSTSACVGRMFFGISIVSSLTARRRRSIKAESHASCRCSQNCCHTSKQSSIKPKPVRSSSFIKSEHRRRTCELN